MCGAKRRRRRRHCRRFDLWMWLCLCFSSCITHMYRLQMHSWYASPSLCINTITRLVHTFAVVVSVLLSFLFYVFPTYSHINDAVRLYRWPQCCCCCCSRARLQLHFGADVHDDADSITPNFTMFHCTLNWAAHWTKQKQRASRARSNNNNSTAAAAADKKTLLKRMSV